MKLLNTAINILILAASALAAGEQSAEPLRLRLQVIDEKRCQLSPSRQELSLRIKLTFSNSGKGTLTIQDIGWPGLVLVARNLKEMKAGVFEVESKGEDFEYRSRRTKSPISLTPGQSYESTQTVSLSVVETPEAGFEVAPGTHYLQVGNAVTVGSDDPHTWRSLPLRSAPSVVHIQYSQDAPACEQR